MKVLYGNEVWDNLEAFWSATPRKCAIAYFTDMNLPFDEGDLLVVDASPIAIKTGQTKASLLRRAFSAKAKVYSWPGLHSKVYVLGTDAFIGSANASKHSRQLMECMAHTRDPIEVGQAIGFVHALAKNATVIDELYLQEIEAIQVDQSPPPNKQKSRQLAPATRRYWLVGLIPLDDPDKELEAKRKALQRSLPDVDVRWFSHRGRRTKLYQDVTEGDGIIEVWNEPGKAPVVHPPAVVVNSVIRGDHRRICHFINRRDYEDFALTWKQFAKLISEAGWDVMPTNKGCREIPERFAERINRLWPGLHD